MKQLSAVGSGLVRRLSGIGARVKNADRFILTCAVTGAVFFLLALTQIVIVLAADMNVPAGTAPLIVIDVAIAVACAVLAIRRRKKPSSPKESEQPARPEQSVPRSQAQPMQRNQAQSVPRSQTQSVPRSQAQPMQRNQTQSVPRSQTQSVPRSQTQSSQRNQAQPYPTARTSPQRSARFNPNDGTVRSTRHQ